MLLTAQSIYANLRPNMTYDDFTTTVRMSRIAHRKLTRMRRASGRSAKHIVEELVKRAYAVQFPPRTIRPAASAHRADQHLPVSAVPADTEGSDPGLAGQAGLFDEDAVATDTSEMNSEN
ncbi:MAG: hypothetical protein M0Z50_15660 [Planctomycetia bacterium]|nr:hypothetical protein [Planctomycetia bacterium]